MCPVIAVALACVSEVGRISDEVVAAILEAEQAQVEGGVVSDVPSGSAVPGDTGNDPAVDRVWPFIAIASPGGHDGRSVDVGRDRGVIVSRQILRREIAVCLAVFIHCLSMGSTCRQGDDAASEH